MLKIIFDQKIAEQWNKKAINPLQSWEWGEARKKMGIKLVRLGEFHQNQLTNVFQLTLHQIPATQLYIGYLPRSVFPNPEVLDMIKKIGQANNCIFIKIEPYETAVNLKNKISNLHLLHPQLKLSPHALFPSFTQILDLKSDKEVLLKKMKAKTRYNIKLAQKKGVVVKEATNTQGFAIFSQLYFATCQRQHYRGHNLNYHQIIFEHLKKNIAHILIAYYNETALAAYELFHFNNRLYYVYGGTCNQYRNLMGANLLMWETILLGQKLKAEYLDMWGSLPPRYNPNHPWAGFTRFKEGYGSEYLELCPSMDLVIKPLEYRLYNLAYQIRSYFL